MMTAPPMFFVLSKVLGVFASLSNLVIGLGLLGVLLLGTRLARAGRFLMVASLIALAVIGLSPLGNVLINPLHPDSRAVIAVKIRKWLYDPRLRR